MVAFVVIVVTFVKCVHRMGDAFRLPNVAQIDDCRRTHNYDSFITTFLTMLAEQGHLADLANDNLSLPRKLATAQSSRAKQTSPITTAAGSRAVLKSMATSAISRRQSKAKRYR